MQAKDKCTPFATRGRAPSPAGRKGFEAASRAATQFTEQVCDDTRITPNNKSPPLGPDDCLDASEHYLRRTDDSGEVEFLPSLPIPK